MRRLLAAGACLAVALLTAVQADFAAAPGFSGRVADCSSCHRPPLQGDDASLTLEGLPQGWDPGARYELTVRVEGGPERIPTGPQAGFELEALDGRLAGDTAGGVRSFHDRQATYTEDGVFQTEWQVAWTAPGLATRPAPVTFWLAGLAANGNHETHLNQSDLGEHGDSVDSLQVVVPHSEASDAAWRALPLHPPVVDQITPRDGGYVLQGRIGDDNATRLWVHNGQLWSDRPAGDPWRLDVEGEGVIRLQNAGADRTSPELYVDLPRQQIGTEPPPERQAPMPAALLPLLAAILWRRP